MNNENYMGLGGFFYFFGVVEDRNDPLKTGRLRVRIVGVHTQDKNVLPLAFMGLNQSLIHVQSLCL